MLALRLHVLCSSSALTWLLFWVPFALFYAMVKCNGTLLCICIAFSFVLTVVFALAFVFALRLHVLCSASALTWFLFWVPFPLFYAMIKCNACVRKLVLGMALAFAVAVPLAFALALALARALVLAVALASAVGISSGSGSALSGFCF